MRIFGQNHLFFHLSSLLFHLDLLFSSLLLSFIFSFIFSFILSCLVLSFVLSFVLSCLVLSCLVVSCLLLSRLVVSLSFVVFYSLTSWRVFSSLSSCRVFSSLSLSSSSLLFRLVFSCLVFRLSSSPVSLFLCLLSLSLCLWSPCDVVCEVVCGSACAYVVVAVAVVVVVVCTRGRFERTHGSRGSSSVLLTKLAHVKLSRASEVHQRNTWIFPVFKFEKKSRTTCSRFLQPFALPDEAVNLQLS